MEKILLDKIKTLENKLEAERQKFNLLHSKVETMRTWQRKFFRANTQFKKIEALEQSKKYEVAVDNYLLLNLPQQTTIEFLDNNN